MIEDRVSVDHVIRILNQAVEDDRQAVAALMDLRIPCNLSLAKHPTIQVGPAHGGHRVGLLGILNGLFGTDDRGYGPISAVYDSDRDKRQPVYLIGFERTKPPKIQKSPQEDIEPDRIEKGD